MDVAGQVSLRFTGDALRTGNHVNLSAVRTDGPHLWVAGDETATIERLVLDSETAPTRAGRQRSFRLADLVQLPGPPNGEADIEGLARSGPWLWAIGSHALVRRRPKPDHDEAKVVRRLGKLRRDPNRFVIVRLAVQLGVDRRPEPVRVSRDGRRSALVGAPGAETLVDLLRTDPHLAPFLAIPAKDNGFDVEGLAVTGERLYVGLRGPVLRGWAVVLELRPVQDPTDPGRLALGILPEGARYRKHFLDLDGLGVRDMCPDGDDLLVLAGPTMALSGPVRIHRWHGAAVADTGRVVREADLSLETVVTHGEGEDHAEGIALLAPDPLDPRARLLVVYDSPAPARRPWPDSVLADRVRIGPAVEVAPEPAGTPAGEPVDVPGGSTGDPLDATTDLPGEPADVTAETPAERDGLAACPAPRQPDDAEAGGDTAAVADPDPDDRSAPEGTDRPAVTGSLAARTRALPCTRSVRPR
jgi:Protein of unknown function (DUF3616)